MYSWVYCAVSYCQRRGVSTGQSDKHLSSGSSSSTISFDNRKEFPNFHILLQPPVMGEQGEPEAEQGNTGVHEIFPFVHPDLYISSPKRGKTRRERRESKLRLNRAVNEVLLNQCRKQSRRGGATRQTEDEAEVDQPEPDPEATSEGDEEDIDILDISGSGFGRNPAGDPLLQEARSKVIGPDSRISAQFWAGVTYLIYVMPPQLTRASAVFSKHLLRKLRRRSVNPPV